MPHGLGSGPTAAPHAGAPDSGAGLLYTAPWVVRYLWFLQPKTAGAPDVRPALRALGALRRAPALRPGHADFGPAALCLRCALRILVTYLKQV